MPEFSGKVCRMEEDPRVKRLGDAVRARRSVLDLTQDQLKPKGGPSNTTISKIEQGVADAVSASTLRKLDRSLGWDEGMARLILNGGDAPGPADPFAELRQRLANLEERVDRLEKGVGDANAATTTQAGESPARSSSDEARQSKARQSKGRVRRAAREDAGPQ